MDQIRNFSIIAHIDHGKSTLADRILEITKSVDPKKMRAQVLDSMDLERERGITIKAQAVRVEYRAADGQSYHLHLIDTPGHVDFSYEVSRSLAACEGALLVVDAAQGVEAQTVANTYLAIENGLELIPVINKVDLPGAEVDRVSGEIADLLGGDPGEALPISAKTGEGVVEVLEAIVARVPPPRGDAAAPTRALIFDSEFDQYRGVVAYVRIVDGTFRKHERIVAMQNGTEADIDDLGFFRPAMTGVERMEAGDVGYLITGIKDVAKLRVGDTLTAQQRPASEPLEGYREVRPMVFCGLFPIDTDRYEDLHDALDKLALNDAALSYEPETSEALGFGFRAGFLGLLHMEIVRERLEREYGLELLATTPNVRYEVELTDGERDRGPQPDRAARPEHDRGDRRALHPGDDHLPDRARRRRDGALPGAPRHPRRHALPEPAAGADPLRPAAGRDRARLLRLPQVLDQGLRLARTTSRSATARPTWSRSTSCWPATRSTRSRSSSTANSPTSRARRWSGGCARRSRGSSSTSPCRRRSARGCSPGRRSRRCARTSPRSSTAAT